MSKKITYGLITALFLFCGVLPAQEKKESVSPAPGAAAKKIPVSKIEQKQEIKIFGFRDRNRDGKNDLFLDANGDGINDVTGKAYQHKFKFVDKNKDKINDLFTDADGDGVNDLRVKFVDIDSDGINDNVVDVDRNHINDITGLRYTRKSLRGYKYGFIKEERLGMMRGFIDEDGDGIADFPRGKMLRDMHDRFIDRDGDGIDDRRLRMRMLRHGPRR